MPDGGVGVVDRSTGEVASLVPANPVKHSPKEHRNADMIRDERKYDDKLRSSYRKQTDVRNQQRRRTLQEVIKGQPESQPETIFAAPIAVPLAAVALSGVNMADGVRRLVRPMADRIRDNKRARQDKKLPPVPHTPVTGSKDTRYVDRSSLR